MRSKAFEAPILPGASTSPNLLEVTPMLVNWKKDADAALAEAKSSGKPLLVDFSAAPA
jgi:uncharacterized protein YyaL (SSP411 family)